MVETDVELWSGVSFRDIDPIMSGSDSEGSSFGDFSASPLRLACRDFGVDSKWSASCRELISVGLFGYELSHELRSLACSPRSSSGLLEIENTLDKHSNALSRSHSGSNVKSAS